MGNKELQESLVLRYQALAAVDVAHQAKRCEYVSPFSPEVMGPVLEVIFEMGKLAGIEEMSDAWEVDYWDDQE